MGTAAQPNPPSLPEWACEELKMTQTNELNFNQSTQRKKLEGVLHFDGSCWPNPGPNSKCGFILRFGMRIVESTSHLGQGTNNTAEYYGVIRGMECALAHGVSRPSK